MIYNIICTNCGGQMQFDDANEHMFCRSCGQKILRISVLSAVNAAAAKPFAPAPRSAGSNLAVSYDTSMTNVQMTLYLDDGSEPVHFTNGKSKKFHLEPGHHTLVFMIGNRSYRRNIEIIPGGPAYKAECGWCDGRAYISINQPSGGIIGN